MGFSSKQTNIFIRCVECITLLALVYEYKAFCGQRYFSIWFATERKPYTVVMLAVA